MKINTKILTTTILSGMAIALMPCILTAQNKTSELKVGDFIGKKEIVATNIDTTKLYKYKPLVVPTDTYYSTQKEYSMSNVGDIESTWDYYKGTGIKIGIIDSGITYGHEDFPNLSNKSAYFETNPYSGAVTKTMATSDNWECMKHEYDSDYSCWDTHGSNVAGCAAASLNAVGTVGIAPEAEIIMCKIDFYDASINEAIKYCADQGCDVINMSLGAYDSEDPHTSEDSYDGVKEGNAEAIQYAINRGVIVVAAAGNESTSAYSYPACNDGVIGAGALAKGSNTKAASFSNFNKSSDTQSGNHNVDIMAPGVVWAPGLDESELKNSKYNYPILGYSETQGTSFASPIVAGAAALWKQKYHGTPAEFESHLYSRAVSMNNFTKFGNGRLDVYKLLDIENEGVTVSTKSLDLTVDSDDQVVSATAKNSTIKSWVSSNTSVVTISGQTGSKTNNATIHVVGVGKSTITVTANDNTTATISVTVKDPGQSVESEVTINFASGGNCTSTSGTFDGVSFTTAKNSASNDPAYNSNSHELRLYYNSQGKGNTCTLTPDDGYTIKGVVITASSTDYTTAVKYNVDGGSDQTGSWSSTTMTISNIEANESFVFRNANTSSKQLRIKSIKVTLESGGTPTPVTPTLSSISLSGSYQTTFNVGDTFSYSGLVVTAHYSDNSSKTVTPTSVSSPDMSTAGNKTVTVSYTEGEVTKTSSYSITVNSVTPPTPTSYSLTVGSPYINGIGYYMYFTSTSTSTGGDYFFTGAMDGYYGGTSKYKSSAAVVYFEESGNGQNVYFYKDNVKNYFSISVSGTHYNFSFGTSVPTTKWIYQTTETYSCLTYTINNVPYTFGTYSSYTTFGTVNLSKNPNNYTLKFVTKDGEGTKSLPGLLNSYISCDFTGESAPTFSDYSWDQFALTTASFSTSDKNDFKNATASSSGTAMEQFVARYDYIVGKYGYTDFLDRSPSPISSGLIKGLENSDNNSMIIIISIAAISALAFTTLLLVKKKKRQ